MNYWRRWRRFWRRRLIKQFGGKCQNCGGTRNLMFAHRHGAPYNFPKGRANGRGSVRRLTDVKREPHLYLLLCGSCHKRYDIGLLSIEGPVD